MTNPKTNGKTVEKIWIINIDIFFVWIFKLSSTDAFGLKFSSLGLGVFFVIDYPYNLFHEN